MTFYMFTHEAEWIARFYVTKVSVMIEKLERHGWTIVDLEPVHLLPDEVDWFNKELSELCHDAYIRSKGGQTPDRPSPVPLVTYRTTSSNPPLRSTASSAAHHQHWKRRMASTRHMLR